MAHSTINANKDNANFGGKHCRQTKKDYPEFPLFPSLSKLFQRVSYNILLHVIFHELKGGSLKQLISSIQ